MASIFHFYNENFSLKILNDISKHTVHKYILEQKTKTYLKL